jgi:hypothetical protein
LFLYKLFSRVRFRLFFAVSGIWLCLAPAARAAVDTVTTTADSGPGSLRNAVAAAGSGDTIVFSHTLAGQTIRLTSGELLIGQNLTIDASALLPGGIIIDGDGNFRVMEIGSGTFVTLNALTVTNGNVGGDPGAGVLLDDPSCSLNANNCVFSGNFDGEYGGAISSYGTLTLNNCTVAGNSASVFGGGIFAEGGVTTLNGCTFSGNAAQVGGGIENEFGTLTLNNCIVSSNTASDFGGGTDAEDEGSVAFTNCVFRGNFSQTAGALSADTTVTANNCAFSNNISTNSTGGTGGGIVNYETMTLCNCTLAGNSVNNNGTGGAMVNSGILTLDNCTLSDNSVPNGQGGGISIEPDTTNILVNCTICSNSAAGGSGGGIYNGGSSPVTLTNTIVAGNAATTDADLYGSAMGVANFIGGNPKLAAPGFYGGPTETMPPLFGSPVIDAGTDWVTNVLATDERGFPRLAGAHADIGAAEAQIAPAKSRPVLSPAWLPGGRGSFRFTFKSVTNADFTVLASTNLALPLAEWTVLGNASQYSAGQFQFTDAPATNNARFYDAVSP